jgi:hypothetical protein
VVPAYTARKLIYVLQQMFPARVVQWPARCPDFSTSVHFVWGYLKSKVYMSQQDNSKLKQNIREVAAILMQMTE